MISCLCVSPADASWFNDIWSIVYDNRFTEDYGLVKLIVRFPFGGVEIRSYQIL